MTTAAAPVPEHHGIIANGIVVFHHGIDHMPVQTAVQRFNKKLAVRVTRSVGTMACAYLFSLIAVISLPAVLVQALHFRGWPPWLVSQGLVVLVSWVAQTYIQLVLLSVIIVGQNIAQEASDARSAKTFEDAEETRGDVKQVGTDLKMALDLLDTDTQGGLAAILAAIMPLHGLLPQEIGMGPAAEAISGPIPDGSGITGSAGM